MIDREPVDIMGVIAFPNPNKDERVIRFIDSEYHTLFTIKDGESIVITRFDGEKMVFPCKYIDDCHVCVGNSAYHICEFAEMQERNGNTYVPSAPKISDEICTYEIYQIPATADVDYYYYTAYNSFVRNYSSYLSMYGLDTSKSLKDQDCPMTDGGTWYAFAAPAGTDQAIVDLLETTILDIMAQPETVQTFENLGNPVVLLGQKEIAEKWSNGYKNAETTLKAIGML